MVSVLPAASDTFTPLPDALRNGLLATTVLAFMSFISSVGAVAYITYRLIRWEWVARWSARHQVGGTDDYRDDSGANDLSLGLEQKHYHQIKTKPKQPSSDDFGLQKSDSAITAVDKRDTRWNPILVLICNLLYADVIQSMSFLLNVAWVRENGIFVSTPACWAQGFFMQVGKVVLSGSLILISVNTYLVIVRGYKAPRWAIYVSSIFIWVFAFAVAMGGILGTRNGRDAGGYYVRADAWCWINHEYSSLRLWLDYFWVFFSVSLTAFIYILVVISLYRNNQSARHLPSMEQRTDKNEPPKPSGHHPAFLIYPVIYIFCATPLALGRMVEMGGYALSNTFYCIVGAIIASHGWLNVLLWSSTFFFIGDKDIQETGLDKFAVIRTPHRRYGNMIWVQGGNDNEAELGDHSGGLGGWWGRLRRGATRFSSDVSSKGHGRSTSEESLRTNKAMDENGIQLEVVTTVVVEDNADPGYGSRRTLRSADSSEKEFEHVNGGYR